MPSPVWLLVPALAAPTAPDRVVFNRDVRPILSDNCYACHGPDKTHRQAKLRLDVRAEAVARGAVAPGKPADSELVARVLLDADADGVMPPADSHKKLTPAQKATLRRWVEQGAEYQGHWAYEPPARAAAPAGADPIDHFVGVRLQAEGLAPAPEADRRTLARRLSFDLVGLPPTPEAVAAFVADARPDAVERYVDSLLASPHYGERMAQGWLDAVRYADTIGYHSDTPRNVWPYRDYVIRAFNANKPFDVFTREQIAGDLLPAAGTEQKVASAFNRLLLTTEEGGAQAKDYEARMLGDRVRAVGTAWLGQTIGCAQCHDHKFDPTSQRDFYTMGAFFADIQETLIGAREPGMPVGTDAELAALARVRAWADAASKAGAVLGPLPGVAAKRAADGAEAKLPKCLVSNSGSPRTVRLLPRGDWMNDTGPVVAPALPAFLAKPPAAGRKLTRLDLADWLVSRDNPLTARVFLNRLWKQFFGAGLSRSVEDFGAQGDWPSHPELLDTLAVEFRDGGWDVKRLVRRMVLSRTYRQASAGSPAAAAKDPDNRLLARQGRFRLDAELVRDNALAVSGLLVPRVGGPSVRPYQPDGYWEYLNFPTRPYTPDAGENQYRRGLYTWWQRSFLHPSLLAFDAPTREECAADRPRSNIPQQALVLLNDPTYVEAARALAAATLRAAGPDPAARVGWAVRRTLQREPRADEVTVLGELAAKHRAAYAADKAAAAAVLKVGFAPAPADLDPAEVAGWTAACRVLLNLHETVTRN